MLAAQIRSHGFDACHLKQDIQESVEMDEEQLYFPTPDDLYVNNAGGLNEVE